jgi:predicted dinucleotide-binding enzyme
MFVCGDDVGQKSIVLKLVAEIGFEAIDAGGLVIARLLEPYAMLWIHLAYGQGMGREFAFGLLKRKSDAR